MNLSKIDLNLLVILKQLLHEKHVSNAALSLGMSQPSVSRSLQKLRSLFEDELLVRTTGGYELTPKAELLKGELDAIVQGLEKFIKGDHFEPASSDNTLKIFGLAPGIMEIMPPVLKEIRQQAPNMVIDIDTIPKRHFESLNEGNVHFVITSFEPNSREQDLYRMVIKPQSYLLVMSASHPLAIDNLTAEKLRYAHFGQISLEGSKALSIEPRFREMGILGRNEKISTPVMLTDFNTAANVAEVSDIIFHLPEGYARDIVKGKNLITREVPDVVKQPNRSVFLYWHKRFHNDPMCIWVRNIFRDKHHVATQPE
ncbi:LysR family transcriptional regulator [Vibrio sp. WXL103]|uniref:LysR family transcriptional regulator n=1 Tax=unclassified Vibrio TaxID=2614977 RepID=UPI003EC85D94